VQNVIKKAMAQLPQLTTVAVIEVATGACLGHHSRSRSFNPAQVGAVHAEMVRQKQQSLLALGARSERLEDILIPLRKQLHLLRLAKNGQWLVYLDVKAEHTSLALAREVLKTITA